MNRRDQALEPLMFIEQQTDKVPESTMQQTYSSMHEQSSTRKQQDTDVHNTTDWKSQRRFIRNIVHEHDIGEEVHPATEDEEEEGPLEKDVEEDEMDEQMKNQTFSDLTIEQKVLYCTSTSSYVPKIICIVKTEKQTIVGAIDKYEDGTVQIKPQRSRVYTKVPIEEIKSIRLAGF